MLEIFQKLWQRLFIHWVDKSKNVWKTVSQLPINTELWDAPLALQG